MLARACSRWPRSLCPFERLLSERARSGRRGVGAGGGEIAIEADGFLDAGEGLLALAQVALPVRKVIERAGEVGAEGVGVGGGEIAIEGGRLLRCWRGPARAGPGRVAGSKGY